METTCSVKSFEICSSNKIMLPMEYAQQCIHQKGKLSQFYHFLVVCHLQLHQCTRSKPSLPSSEMASGPGPSEVQAHIYCSLQLQCRSRRPVSWQTTISGDAGCHLSFVIRCWVATGPVVRLFSRDARRAASYRLAPFWIVHNFFIICAMTFLNRMSWLNLHLFSLFSSAFDYFWKHIFISKLVICIYLLNDFP